MEIIASTAIGLAGAFAIAMFGLLAVLYQRMGGVESDVRNLRRDMQDLRRELREEIRTSTQRLITALRYHEHRDEGRVTFSTPPTTAPGEAAPADGYVNTPYSRMGRLHPIRLGANGPGRGQENPGVAQRPRKWASRQGPLLA